MTAISTTGPAPHPRSRLRARIVLAGFTAAGLAALAWAAFVQPLPRLIYNPSDSVAVGWYRVQPLDHRAASLPRPLSVDSIVLTRLPADAAALAAVSAARRLARCLRRLRRRRPLHLVGSVRVGDGPLLNRQDDGFCFFDCGSWTQGPTKLTDGALNLDVGLVAQSGSRVRCTASISAGHVVDATVVMEEKAGATPLARRESLAATGAPWLAPSLIPCIMPSLVACLAPCASSAGSFVILLQMVNVQSIL